MNYDELLDFSKKLDRSEFIESEFRLFAHVDEALPIGFGQTISQPSLVVEMTRILNPDKKSRVLEIGTGTGYQTAFLSHFSESVYTIEIVPELASSAKERLRRMGYINITYKVGDGSTGWAEHAPFDRIMVTAAAKKVPDELIEQLAPEGRMVIPVGPPSVQMLTLVTKDKRGKISISEIEYVQFVELRGKYGWWS